MFAEITREIMLARGLIDTAGRRHQRALLRPLNGWEEVQLAQGRRLDSCAIHQLLAVCLIRIGGYQEVTPALAAALSRGDRMRLALELRSLMFGDRLLVSLRCSNPACAEIADLDLSIGELLDDAGEPEPEYLDVQTPEGAARIRPPVGADDEICEAVADRRARSGLLWSRLLLSIGDRDHLAPEDWWALRPETRQRIALALHEIQRGPDLAIISRCPYCRALMEMTIEPFHLLAGELHRGAQRLLPEIHCLAFHYGWSEDQVLALPRYRRWAYLQLLADQLNGRPLSQNWS